MNKDITAALLFLRDELKQKAQDVLKPAEDKLKEAKQEYHDAKILSNQLLKRAQKVQSLVTIEMQREYNESVEAEDAWEVKGNTELKNNLETDDCLMELIKKVN